MTSNLTLIIADDRSCRKKNCHKVKINPFFKKLSELFPDREFMIYDDSGQGKGPFIYYPWYVEWNEYKNGEKIGLQMRKNKNITKQEIIKIKEKFKKLPQRKHVDMIKKFIIINGYLESLLDNNQHMLDVESFSHVLGNIEYNMEFIEDELYDNISEYYPELIKKNK